jgi:hypothetical protein
MNGVAADWRAFGEAVVFLRYFKDMPVPHQRGKITCPLDDVLLPSLRAVLAGAETFADIACFGARKLALLPHFQRYCDGTPSPVTLAIASPPSTPDISSAASSPGWPR